MNSWGGGGVRLQAGQGRRRRHTNLDSCTVRQVAIGFGGGAGVAERRRGDVKAALAVTATACHHGHE
eukprot:2012913-Pleurochrysis_carterae.AAC.1